MRHEQLFALFVDLKPRESDDGGDDDVERFIAKAEITPHISASLPLSIMSTFMDSHRGGIRAKRKSCFRLGTS